MNAWLETSSKKEVRKEEWMSRAACLGHPLRHLFFADRGEARQLDEVRPICASCPVWRDCVKYALTNEKEFGLWGGLTVKERRTVRRPDQVKKCRNCNLIRVFHDSDSLCDRCSGITSRERLKRLRRGVHKW